MWRPRLARRNVLQNNACGEAARETPRGTPVGERRRLGRHPAVRGARQCRRSVYIYRGRCQRALEGAQVAPRGYPAVPDGCGSDQSRDVSLEGPGEGLRGVGICSPMPFGGPAISRGLFSSYGSYQFRGMKEEDEGYEV